MAAGQLRQRIEVIWNNEIGQLCETAKLLPARLGTVLGQFTESSQLLTVSSRHFSVSGNKAVQGMEHLGAEPEQVAAATEKHVQSFLLWVEVARNTLVSV